MTKPKGRWSLVRAKAQLGVVIDRALAEGPQTIMRGGHPDCCCGVGGRVGAQAQSQGQSG
jgi:hypothetical protein